MQEGRKHLKKYANNISAISPGAPRVVCVCFCAIEKEMNGRQKKLNHLQQLGLCRGSGSGSGSQLWIGSDGLGGILSAAPWGGVCAIYAASHL